MTDTHTVAVTGAAGYIGSRVTRDLLEAGHDVVPVDDFSAGRIESVDGVDVREVDVRDEQALRGTFADEGIDAVMHLAAVSGVQACTDEPRRSFDVNVRGTESVTWYCRDEGVPLVFPCSMAVVGNPPPEAFPIDADTPREPVNHYGLTKKMSEDDIHDLARGEFPAHVYLKSNLYGGHRIGDEFYAKRTVINVFVEKALDREPLTVHEPGTQSRDFLHVRDVARAYLGSLEALVDGADATPGARSLTLASGEQYSIRELAELVQRVVREERGYEVPVEMVDNPREGEVLVEDYTVDTSTAADVIGFETRHTVEETVRRLLG